MPGSANFATRSAPALPMPSPAHAAPARAPTRVAAPARFTHARASTSRSAGANIEWPETCRPRRAARESTSAVAKSASHRASRVASARGPRPRLETELDATEESPPGLGEPVVDHGLLVERVVHAPVHADPVFPHELRDREVEQGRVRQLHALERRGARVGEGASDPGQRDAQGSLPGEGVARLGIDLVARAGVELVERRSAAQIARVEEAVGGAHEERWPGVALHGGLDPAVAKPLTVAEEPAHPVALDEVVELEVEGRERGDGRARELLLDPDLEAPAALRTQVGVSAVDGVQLGDRREAQFAGRGGPQPRPRREVVVGAAEEEASVLRHSPAAVEPGVSVADHEAEGGEGMYLVFGAERPGADRIARVDRADRPAAGTTAGAATAAATAAPTATTSTTAASAGAIVALAVEVLGASVRRQA